MAMTDRAWRKSISSGTTEREFYPSDQTPGNEGFVLPSMTTIFEITIPENTFVAQASRYVVGLVKTSAHYEFSQRRTDIVQLV